MISVITTTHAHKGMYTTNLRRVGNSTGLTLPKDILREHNLAEGDKVHLVHTADGLLISPFDPDFQAAMDAYEEGEPAHRDAMRELARR